MDLPNRKPNRLKKFDYSQPNAYFITICTKNRELLFWKNVGASIARLENGQLSHYGEIVKEAITNIPEIYPAISVDHYVIMPNHIHLLLQIHSDDNGRAMLAPTVSKVIQQMKGYVTKKIGVSVWQKLFHDHVVRNQQDYAKIWEYIENNPKQWELDCFYVKEGEHVSFNRQ